MKCRLATLALAQLVVVLLCCISFTTIAAQIEPVAKPISIVNMPQDQAIAARLLAITNAIAGLEQVEVKVEAGVLSLSGEVANAQLSRDVEKIANRLEGVVYVQNNLQEQLAVRSRLAPASESFKRY